MAAKEPEIRAYPPPQTEEDAQAIFEIEGGKGSYRDFLSQSLSSASLEKQLDWLSMAAKLIPHLPR